MTDRRPKIAALIADAFQEEEYFLPKVALNEAGYQVEVVSSRKEPVEIYSYFARTGLLDVERAITEVRPEDYCDGAEALAWAFGPIATPSVPVTVEPGPVEFALK
jgi:putative intracellular protease/amidase